MNMQHIGRNRKSLIIAVVVILFAVTAAGIFLQRRKADSYHAAQTCAEYGPTYDYFDGPSSIKEMANDSTMIAVVTPENPNVLGKSLYPNDPKPTVKIKEVIKGNSHVGEVVSVCSGLGLIDLQAGEHPTLVLFAEGKDSNVWIPVRGSIGIVPQDKDGHFTPKGMSQEPKSATLNELRKIVK